jgi:hypothetical protein
MYCLASRPATAVHKEEAPAGHVPFVPASHTLPEASAPRAVVGEQVKQQWRRPGSGQRHFQGLAGQMKSKEPECSMCAACGQKSFLALISSLFEQGTSQRRYDLSSITVNGVGHT